MDELADLYDEALIQLVRDWAEENNSTFAATW
jgi:hypothetical protein